MGHSIPPPLVRLIHRVLVEHYRQYHRDLDSGHAEVFAETFPDKLFGLEATTDANRAVANLDVQELPLVAPGGDDTFRFCGALRDTLCREIRNWLLNSGVFQYNVEMKALAYARAVAVAADEWTYISALENARRGYPSEARYAGLPDAERAAHEAEERYQEGRRR
jgi:hypothetical protein